MSTPFLALVHEQGGKTTPFSGEIVPLDEDAVSSWVFFGNFTPKSQEVILEACRMDVLTKAFLAEGRSVTCYIKRKDQQTVKVYGVIA